MRDLRLRQIPIAVRVSCRCFATDRLHSWDAALIEAAQRVEHYKIAAYATLGAFANLTYWAKVSLRFSLARAWRKT